VTRRRPLGGCCSGSSLTGAAVYRRRRGILDAASSAFGLSADKTERIVVLYPDGARPDRRWQRRPALTTARRRIAR
jgi:hypothetical protein